MKTIPIDRPLEEIDNFVIQFVQLLRKHSPYVIVSGYVAIIFGRSRATEYVDIIIPKQDSKTIGNLVTDLLEHGYWCINTDSLDEILGILQDGSSVRFAKKPTIIPNIELKFVKNKYDLIALQDKIAVKIGDHELFISPLELQIAFKEIALGSDKDKEDAMHIAIVAKEHINTELVEEYKRALRSEQ